MTSLAGGVFSHQLPPRQWLPFIAFPSDRAPRGAYHPISVTSRAASVNFYSPLQIWNSSDSLLTTIRFLPFWNETLQLGYRSLVGKRHPPSRLSRDPWAWSLSIDGFCDISWASPTWGVGSVFSPQVVGAFGRPKGRFIPAVRPTGRFRQPLISDNPTGRPAGRSYRRYVLEG